MIPRIIHYCWFGRNPKPALAEKCLKSWRKFCPDYQIIEWNEDNFDLEAAPNYVRQAYQAKKWAFVTDYVRLCALAEHGGLYMDTDVELVKKPDALLKGRAFMGFEDKDKLSTGVMACEKGFPLFQQFTRYYDDVSFIKPDGSLNVTTNVETVTRICVGLGLVLDGNRQTVEGMDIYPQEVFSPICYETGKLHRTRKTVTIHWFSGSWHTQAEKDQRKADIRWVRREQKVQARIRFAKGVLGESGYERWAERMNRYRSWDEIRRMPVRIVRKMFGLKNEE